MLKVALVGLGGFVGAIARYLISSSLINVSHSWGFPFGTLVVNISGCLAIGFLSRMDELKNIFEPEMRLVIFMGFLGAYTTFSTFGNETMQLIQSKRIDFAILNVLTHIILGLIAVISGRLLATVFIKL